MPNGVKNKAMNVVRLGTVDYQKALDDQFSLVAKRQDNAIEDTLLMLEHPPVITLGTRGKNEHILADSDQLCQAGVSIIKTNRGGDVTYHGPGQLVGYLIFDLLCMQRNIRRFVHTIEQALIDYLFDQHHIKAEQGAGKETGLWVKEHKIASLGLAVKRGISMHGFALNINTDLRHFSWINACGLGKPVTSIQALTGQTQDMDAAQTHLVEKLAFAFKRNIHNTTILRLLSEEGGS